MLHLRKYIFKWTVLFISDVYVFVACIQLGDLLHKIATVKRRGWYFLRVHKLDLKELIQAILNDVLDGSETV